MLHCRDSAGSAPRKRLTFSVGRVVIQFESDDDPVMDCVYRRFGAFSEMGRPDFRIVQRVDRRPPADLCSPFEIRHESVHDELVGERLISRGESFDAVVDFERGAAEIRGPAALYPLEHLLRILGPRGNELLLHGATLIDERRGWACCGPSGAGKSTLAELLHSRARCDELSAVTRSGAGFEIRSTPYWKGSPGCATLHEVCLLVQAPEHSKRALSRSEAVARLAPLVLWPVHFPSLMARTLSCLTRLIESTPVSELRFAPDSAVWSAVEGEV